nr:MAG: hypothetical protein [Caudoviricetes sp.]
MKYLFLLLLSMNVYAEDIKLLRVIDADTFIVSAPFLPPPLKPQMPLRLSTVDTPNINRWAKCDRENKLGQSAKSFVEKLIKTSKTNSVKIVGVDKYGRWLGHVYLNGKSLSDILVEKKMARYYYGGKKLSWCN